MENNEEHGHEEHDCEHKNENGEHHTLIEVSVERDQEYHVEFAYFMSEVGRKLFTGPMKLAPNEEDNDVMVTTYSVMAASMMDAIRRAEEIDKARKMESITAYVNVIAEKSEEGQVPFTPEVIKDFREFMIREQNFTEYFLTEPTSVTAVLAKNRDMCMERSTNNILKDKLNIGDDIENWLKEDDDNKTDEDS